MGHQALDPHEHEGTHLVWVRIRPSRGRVARIFKSWETWRLERAKKVQPARQANTVCEERVHFSLAREESDVGCKVLVSRSIQDEKFDDALAGAEPSQTSIPNQIKRSVACEVKSPSSYRDLWRQGHRDDVLGHQLLWVFTLWTFSRGQYIKHRPKNEAMKGTAKRLRQRDACDLIEGDGSAWDSCCTPDFRDDRK